MSTQPGLSPFSAVSHSFHPASSQSPVDPQAITHQSMSQVTTSLPLQSPSVAFSNLTLRTPHRAIPASLPPTPKLGPGSSPQIPATALASPFLPQEQSPLPSNVRMNYTKMLRRGSAAARRTGMGPPPAPMELTSEATLRQEDFWTEVNTFLNDVGNGRSSSHLVPPHLRPQYMAANRDSFACVSCPLFSRDTANA